MSLVSISSLSLILEIKVIISPSGAPFRPDRRGLQGTNTLAYLATLSVTKKNSRATMTPEGPAGAFGGDESFLGTKVIKRFLSQKIT